MALEKVISGGQTGVDRAALAAALELGIPVGGWIPKGRLTEDGPLDPKYPLTETESGQYPERTRLNVRDADATVVFTTDRKSPGTALTIKACRDLGKPHYVIELFALDIGVVYTSEIKKWLRQGGFRIVNVAGTRESKAPGVYKLVKEWLLRDLGELIRSEDG